MGFLDKPTIKRMWGMSQRTSLSDDEYNSRCEFMYGTMMGSGYETKCWFGDYCPFNRAHHPDWVKLYHRWVASDKQEWACFDKPGRLEFVCGGNVVESLEMPNQWASGTGFDPRPNL